VLPQSTICVIRCLPAVAGNPRLNLKSRHSTFGFRHWLSRNLNNTDAPLDYDYEQEQQSATHLHIMMRQFVS
jgi:hypothetical protein